MKATFSPTEHLTIQLEAESPKDLFEKIAGVQEIFTEPCCGMCGSINIRGDVREFDSNMYYKYLCLGCGATLDLGQKKDNVNLFVKRKLPNGDRDKKCNGWFKHWERNPKDGNAASSGQRQNDESSQVPQESSGEIPF